MVHFTELPKSSVMFGFLWAACQTRYRIKAALTWCSNAGADPGFCGEALIRGMKCEAGCVREVSGSATFLCFWVDALCASFCRLATLDAVTKKNAGDVVTGNTIGTL